MILHTTCATVLIGRESLYIGNWNGKGRLHTCVFAVTRSDRITQTHQERGQKVASIPNELAKGDGSRRLHNGCIFHALTTKGAGIDTGVLYFIPYTFFESSILAWIDGDGGLNSCTYTFDDSS